MESKPAEKKWKAYFGEITEKNVENLRAINLACLPVRYQDSFYHKAIGYSNYSKFGKRKKKRKGKEIAYFNDIIVGGICARDEVKSNGEKTVYILTIGVFEPYRRMGIGSQLIEEMERLVKERGIAKSIYLHVQSSNEAAIEFYKKHGYAIIEKLENYYKDIDPPHCFVVEKKI